MKKLLFIILLFVISSLPTPPEGPAPIIAEVQKDSTKIRKQYPISKLDTTSVVHDLRKHIEVIDSQQKQLDSLLKMKKKK